MKPALLRWRPASRKGMVFSRISSLHEMNSMVFPSSVLAKSRITIHEHHDLRKGLWQVLLGQLLLHMALTDSLHLEPLSDPFCYDARSARWRRSPSFPSASVDPSIRCRRGLLHHKRRLSQRPLALSLSRPFVRPFFHCRSHRGRPRVSFAPNGQDRSSALRRSVFLLLAPCAGWLPAP